jgi:hypothetical protein
VTSCYRFHEMNASRSAGTRCGSCTAGLYGEYLWQLCDAGADLAVADLDAAHVFVNLAGGTRFAPSRPESVYDLVKRLRRDLAGQVPRAWTPHWMRHSHATALQRRGVASDATFRGWREAGPVRAADSVPPRPEPIMDEKVQVKNVHEDEVAAGDSMCHRVLLHRKTA